MFFFCFSPVLLWRTTETQWSPPLPAGRADDARVINKWLQIFFFFFTPCSRWELKKEKKANKQTKNVGPVLDAITFQNYDRSGSGFKWDGRRVSLSRPAAAHGLFVWHLVAIQGTNERNSRSPRGSWTGARSAEPGRFEFAWRLSNDHTTRYCHFPKTTT